MRNKLVQLLKCRLLFIKEVSGFFMHKGIFWIAAHENETRSVFNLEYFF